MQTQKPFRRRRRLQRHQTPTMQKLAQHCVGTYGLHFSVSGQRRAVNILRILYLQGVDDRLNLTLGGLERPSKVLNLLKKYGLVGFSGQDAYITGEGLQLGNSLGFEDPGFGD